MTHSEVLLAALGCRDSLEDGPWMTLMHLAAHQFELMTLAELAEGVALPEPVALDHLRSLVTMGHVTFTAGLPQLHFEGDAVFHGLMHRLTRTRTVEVRHGL